MDREQTVRDRLLDDLEKSEERRRLIDTTLVELGQRLKTIANKREATIECTFKILKSGQFDWERGRVTATHRVTILLMGVSCALWALWLLGREYERIPQVKPTTPQPQRRRHRLITDGYHAFRLAVKRQQPLQMPVPRPPRVLEYQRVFVAANGRVG